jgi:hypothetical protein
VATILAVPYLRDFYALALPSGAIVAEGGAIAVLGIVLIELGWRTSQFVQRRYAAASDRDAHRAAGAPGPS